MRAFERHINIKQLYGEKALHIPACRSALMIMYVPDETTIILKTGQHFREYDDAFKLYPNAFLLALPSIQL